MLTVSPPGTQPSIGLLAGKGCACVFTTNISCFKRGWEWVVHGWFWIIFFCNFVLLPLWIHFSLHARRSLSTHTLAWQQNPIFVPSLLPLLEWLHGVEKSKVSIICTWRASYPLLESISNLFCTMGLLHQMMVLSLLLLHCHRHAILKM